MLSKRMHQFAQEGSGWIPLSLAVHAPEVRTAERWATAPVLPGGFPNHTGFIPGRGRAICMRYLFFSELSKDRSFRGGMRVQILAWEVNLQYERKRRIS